MLTGPVRARITKSGGQVVKIRTYVGGRWRPTAGTVTSIGAVSAREADDYLMSVRELLVDESR